MFETLFARVRRLLPGRKKQYYCDTVEVVPGTSSSTEYIVEHGYPEGRSIKYPATMGPVGPMDSTSLVNATLESIEGAQRLLSAPSGAGRLDPLKLDKAGYGPMGLARNPASQDEGLRRLIGPVPEDIPVAIYDIPKLDQIVKPYFDI